MKLKLHRLIRHKFAVLALLASSSVIHATNVTTDITEDTTWSLANSPYVLKDYIFVVSPATLTIEAGVVVQADEGSGTAAPALVVTQGAKFPRSERQPNQLRSLPSWITPSVPSPRTTKENGED